MGLQCRLNMRIHGGVPGKEWLGSGWGRVIRLGGGPLNCRERMLHQGSLQLLRVCEVANLGTGRFVEPSQRGRAVDEMCCWSGKGAKLNWETLGLEGEPVITLQTADRVLGSSLWKSALSMLVAQVAPGTGVAVNQPDPLCAGGCYFFWCVPGDQQEAINRAACFGSWKRKFLAQRLQTYFLVTLYYKLVKQFCTDELLKWSIFTLKVTHTAFSRGLKNVSLIGSELLCFRSMTWHTLAWMKWVDGHENKIIQADRF